MYKALALMLLTTPPEVNINDAIPAWGTWGRIEVTYYLREHLKTLELTDEGIPFHDLDYAFIGRPDEWNYDEEPHYIGKAVPHIYTDRDWTEDLDIYRHRYQESKNWPRAVDIPRYQWVKESKFPFMFLWNLERSITDRLNKGFELDRQQRLEQILEEIKWTRATWYTAWNVNPSRIYTSRKALNELRERLDPWEWDNGVLPDYLPPEWFMEIK